MWGVTFRQIWKVMDLIIGLPFCPFSSSSLKMFTCHLQFQSEFYTKLFIYFLLLTISNIPLLQCPTCKHIGEQLQMRVLYGFVLKVALKRLLLTFCPSHRSVPCWIIIRVSSSRNRQGQMQRSTARNLAELRDLGTLSWKLGISIKSLPTGLRELRRRESGKNLSARGDVGYHGNKAF